MGTLQKKGEKYITGIYLVKKGTSEHVQNKTKIFYKKHWKDVYINQAKSFVQLFR